MERKISKTLQGQRTVDGAGVRLVRVLGYNDVKSFDPFLMLDAFDSTNPDDYTAGFPMHPHRGIETVTYLISGDIEHQDSLGNKGSIKDGSCQWMTAGSGIMHQEMPQASERMLGLQLWINLPAKDKMAYPKYRDLRAETIPEVHEDGAAIRVLSGRYKDMKGAIEGDYVKTDYLDVELQPGKEWRLAVNPDATAFVYIILGSLSCEKDSPPVEARRAVLFTPGEEIVFKAGPAGARFVFLSGKPLHEPIEWGGPIVMNTAQELRQAFFELEDGTFIKHNAMA